MDFHRPSHAGSIWVGRFGARMLAQQPSMHPIQAVQCAVATWPYASQLEPEAAADICAVRRSERRLRRFRSGSYGPSTTSELP